MRGAAEEVADHDDDLPDPLDDLPERGEVCFGWGGGYVNLATTKIRAC